MAGEALKINCDTCRSACCRKGIRIGLTNDERRFLEDGGTSFSVEMLPEDISPTIARGQHIKNFDVLTNAERLQNQRYALAERLRQEDLGGNTGFFTFESDCGYLGKRSDGSTYCQVYNDERRPEICTKFKAGSSRCYSMRLHAGIDSDD